MKITISFLLSLQMLFSLMFSYVTDAPTEFQIGAAVVSESSQYKSQVVGVDPTPQPVINQKWQIAYMEFIRGHIPVNKVDTVDYVYRAEEVALIGAFLAAGYPIDPFFYLYDIDKNGIPEIIYIDAANKFDGDVDVYTYADNLVIKVGSIEFYPFGGLGMPLNRTDGIYSDIGYKGQNGGVYLYTMDNGILTGKLVFEYNNQSEGSQQKPGLCMAFNKSCDFAWLDYYEVTESNIQKLIFGDMSYE